ncbi:hypothetical protein [Anaerobranca gottschalkii]|uniref:Membrane domain of glycerophosphoryl diester phosphodiesterase n=1 Tax=Anaerobranca gottschalkii DSM 13577 TaxID=1120990 RepID=A0A1I0AQI6_9FIRM|nr:hypothetical protein [Anaerobranca gottschalkii]SES96553.1 hypothetical protein SAMN03080614_102521 [Anaerobranca gottschalkii DSM 13577]
MSISNAISFGFSNFKKLILPVLLVIVFSLVYEFFLSAISSSFLHLIFVLLQFLIYVLIQINFIKIALKIYNNEDITSFEIFNFANNDIEEIFSVIGIDILIALIMAGINIIPFIIAINALLNSDFILAVLMFIIIGLISIVTIAYLFIPIELCVDKGDTVLDSIKGNFKLCKKHVLKIILFNFVILFLNIIGVLMLIVGVLITIPVSILANIHIYKQIIGK